MKKVLLLTVAGLMTAVAFGQKKESRSVSDFIGIDASNVFHITVTKGDVASLLIEADDAVMEYVRSEVRNGVLRLYLDSGYERRTRNIKTLRATVVMQALDRVSLSGACTLTSKDLFTSNAFRGVCSGASQLKVNVHADRLSIGASGASKIEVEAQVAGESRLSLSGASKIEANLKTKNVKINSSGVSSIGLTGAAADIKIDISGTSNVKADKFTVQTATVGSSGTSSVTIGVTDTLKVNSSGASSVYYKGSPTLQVSSSGVSKVRSL